MKRLYALGSVLIGLVLGCGDDGKANPVPAKDAGADVTTSPSDSGSSEHDSGITDAGADDSGKDQ